MLQQFLPSHDQMEGMCWKVLVHAKTADLCMNHDANAKCSTVLVLCKTLIFELYWNEINCTGLSLFGYRQNSTLLATTFGIYLLFGLC